MRFWRERGSRWMGMRSRAPPVADAARRSTRSGRKNRASEQREDYFGHRKAVGADAAAGYLWSASVRSTDLDFSPQKNPNSCPALQATERGSSRGNLSPLTVFWFLLYAQKERPGGEPYSLCLCKRLRDADRRSQIRPKNTFFYFSFLPCKKRKSRISATFLCGGDARARTVDLLRVKQAL